MTAPALATPDESSLAILTDEIEHAPDAVGADAPATEEVTLNDFHAVMPLHSFFNVRTGEMWPAASVNARIASIVVGVEANGKPKTIKASTWLDQNRHVEQVTWAPGEPQIIADRVIADGGWIRQPGYSCLNLYRPPLPTDGDPAHAGRWVEHVCRVYPREADHIIRWLAQRVQSPGVKINHALVLGGAQGIGKDSIVEPVKRGVGPWNCEEVSPKQLLGRFNGYLKSVILRVSEMRDQGDVDRYAFYEHTKTLIAAPPDVLRCDEKNLREYSVPNVCGVIFTTNHKTDGLYLPADDRRHFVAWSDCTKEAFPADYWPDLHAWYAAGGVDHVTAYLTALDLSSFDPKAPPPKTAAFYAIVDANRAPEDAELADVMERLGWPEATTLSRILAECTDPSFAVWLRDRGNSRKIPHRLHAVGYEAFRNPDAAADGDGRWKIGGKNVVVYVLKELNPRERHVAARLIVEARR